jgi:glutamate transport system permease protein
MTAVLFDNPGPRARARHRLLAWLSGFVVAGLAAFCIVRLAESGQFSAGKWRLFTFSTVWREIAQATGATLSAFAVGAVLALALGVVLVVGRLSQRRWIRISIGGLVDLLRSIPLLILMMLLYYGLPSVGVTVLSPFGAVVIGLALYNGSVMAEILRAGIQSLPAGQSEAARAIGLTRAQSLRLILFPQAVRAMLPVILSQLVVVLKDTALGFIVTYPELLHLAKFYGSSYQYGSPIIPSAIVIGSIYVSLCLLLSGCARVVERRTAPRRSAGTGPRRQRTSH